MANSALCKICSSLFCPYLGESGVNCSLSVERLGLGCENNLATVSLWHQCVEKNQKHLKYCMYERKQMKENLRPACLG